MAIYFLDMTSVGRSGGSNAVNFAAYRAGERLRDERTGRTFDYTGRQGVMHTEILLPRHLNPREAAWTQDRSTLWNAAERAETRANARVAREFLVALPVELDHERRIELVRTFSRELTDRYKFALDVAVHAPRDYPDSDQRNFHAHLLATTREVTPAGLTSKTTFELGDNKRRELELPPVVHEVFHVRERWAAVTNEALRDANIDARIDHRSLAAQGIDREPYPRIPRAAFEMERHGFRNELAERLRADYHARVQARLEGAALRETAQREVAQRDAARREPGPQDAARQQTARRQSAEQATPARAAARPQSLEEIRRQAREDWLRMREAAKGAGASPAAADRSRGPAADDDYSR